MLKPLPPRQFPIAGSAAPAQEYYEYFAALDQQLRAAPDIAGTYALDLSAVGHTLAVTDLLAGVLLRNGPAGAFADTTPSATLIVSAIPMALINTSRLITIANYAGGLMTINAGTGVTLAGNTTIGAGVGRVYLLTVTGVTPGAETVSLLGLMTGAL